MKLLIGSALLAGALIAGVAAALTVNAAPMQGQSANASVAVMTSFPGLTSATGEPTLPSLPALHPQPGALVQADGPFDDRFTLADLAFDGSTVSGTITITSAVSDLLELQVVAGFYAADGSLLSTGQFVQHASGDEAAHAGPPSGHEAFQITVPGGLAKPVVSVAVGVPVLVNE